jgi:hypothetical protein
MLSLLKLLLNQVVRHMQEMHIVFRLETEYGEFGRILSCCLTGKWVVTTGAEQKEQDRGQFPTFVTTVVNLNSHQLLVIQSLKQL